MLQTDPRWQPKKRIAVRLQTVDGETLEGFVFVPPDMRVSDVVNGFQPFLPFERDDGQFDLISKVSLTRVTPDDAEHKKQSVSKAGRARGRHRPAPEPRRAHRRASA